MLGFEESREVGWGAKRLKPRYPVVRTFVNCCAFQRYLPSSSVCGIRCSKSNYSNRVVLEDGLTLEACVSCIMCTPRYGSLGKP